MRIPAGQKSPRPQCASARRLALLAAVLSVLNACGAPQPSVPASIEFTRLPPSGEGSPDKLEEIEGRAMGAQQGERIVLFARSGMWWVQPTADKPFTPINPGGTWKNFTHPGSAYAALLVTADYKPPTTAKALPEKGGPIRAVAVAEGAQLTRSPGKTIDFSGYQWELRRSASNRGGTNNAFDPANVWTDQQGFLHLRVNKTPERWTCAEVSLSRSLGYGSYRFVTRDVAHLEPALVFSIFTWDEAGPSREMDIEISRWGESVAKNAQYVIQPYYVPANVIRFTAPAGVLTHHLRWEPGRMRFRTTRGTDLSTNIVSEHSFTSGVPSPGNELVHINLYVYDNSSNPLRQGSEVIVEKFEYLP